MKPPRFRRSAAAITAMIIAAAVQAIPEQPPQAKIDSALRGMTF
jgi:hypothetical protein